MTVTLEAVAAALEPDEPDYAEAAALGPDSLRHLETLISREDVGGLAAKAAYLAGLINHPDAPNTVARAARNDNVLIRIAAAATLSNLPASARDSVALPLLDDDDLGVRKVTLDSVARFPKSTSLEPQLLEKLYHMRRHEPDPALRKRATDASDGR